MFAYILKNSPSVRIIAITLFLIFSTQGIPMVHAAEPLDLESERQFIQELRKYIKQNNIIEQNVWVPLEDDLWSLELGETTVDGKKYPIRLIIEVDPEIENRYNLKIEEKKENVWVRRYRGSPIGHYTFDQETEKFKWTAFITEENIERVLTKLKIPFETYQQRYDRLSPIARTIIEEINKDPVPSFLPQQNRFNKERIVLVLNELQIPFNQSPDEINQLVEVVQIEWRLKQQSYILPFEKYQEIGDRCYAAIESSDVWSKNLVQKVFPLSEKPISYSKTDNNFFESIVESSANDSVSIVLMHEQVLDLSLRLSILNLIAFVETYKLDSSPGLANESYFSSVWKFDDDTINNRKYKNTYKEMVSLYRGFVGSTPVRTTKSAIQKDILEFNKLTAQSRNICQRANNRFDQFVSNEYVAIERSNNQLQDSQFKAKYMGSYESEMQVLLAKIRESKIGSIFLASEEVRDEMGHYDPVDCFRHGNGLSDLKYEDIVEGTLEIEKNLIDQIEEAVADQGMEQKKVLKKYLVNYPQTIQTVLAQNMNKNQMYCVCGLIENIYDEDQYYLFRDFALMAVPVLGEYLATAKILGTVRVMYGTGMMAYSAADYYKGYRTEKELSMAWASGQANKAYAQQEMFAADQHQTRAAWSFTISAVATGASVYGMIKNMKGPAGSGVTSPKNPTSPVDPSIDEAKQLMNEYQALMSGSEKSSYNNVRLEILIEKMKKNPHIKFTSQHPTLASAEIFPGPQGRGGVNLHRPQPNGGVAIDNPPAAIKPTPTSPQGGSGARVQTTLPQPTSSPTTMTATQMQSSVSPSSPMIMNRITLDKIPAPSVQSGLNPSLALPVLPRIVESPEAPDPEVSEINRQRIEEAAGNQKGLDEHGILRPDRNNTAERIVQGLAVFDLAYLDEIIEIARQGGELGRKAQELLENYQNDQKERYWYSIYYYASLKQELEKIEKNKQEKKREEQKVVNDLKNGIFHIYEFPQLFLLAHGESETASEIRKLLGMQRTPSGHIRINVTQIDRRLARNLSDQSIRQFRETLRFMQTMMDVNMINHLRLKGRSEIEGYLGLRINDKTWEFITATPINSVETYRSYFSLHYNGAEKSDLGALLNWYPAEVIFNLSQFQNLHISSAERMYQFLFGMINGHPRPLESIIHQSVGNQDGLSRSHYHGSGEDVLIQSEGETSHPSPVKSELVDEYIPEVEHIFSKIQVQYQDMLSNLKRRDALLDIFLRQGILTKEDIFEQKLKYSFKQFPDEFSDEVSEFNEIIQRIKVQNHFIVSEVEKILETYGFGFVRIEIDGVQNLRIIPRERTKFYEILMGYHRLWALSDDPKKNQKIQSQVEKYRFIFDPLFLHNFHASAAYEDFSITFGLGSLKSIILNEILPKFQFMISPALQHEIRHLFTHLTRLDEVPNAFQQAYLWANGSLIDSESYKNFLSADEIYAYGSNLRNGIEEFRRESIDSQINFAANSLKLISEGILKNSYEILLLLQKGDHFRPETIGDRVPLIQIRFSDGRVLRKYFVSKEEKNLFLNYLNNPKDYESLVIQHMYSEQLKINHIAYYQAVYVGELRKCLDQYANYKEDPNDSLSKNGKKFLVEKIIEIALKTYQAGKNFNFDQFEKMDEVYWNWVVNQSLQRINAEAPVFDGLYFDFFTRGVSFSIEESQMSEHSDVVRLYSVNQKVKNYSNLIIDVKKGQVLDFGDGKKFTVEKFVRTFTHFYLVQTSEGKILRIPTKSTGKDALHKFFETHQRLKSLGVPVLEILDMPSHGRYVVHEAIFDPYFQIGSLANYQSTKDGANGELWKDVKNDLNQSVVEFGKRTYKILGLSAFTFDQVLYTFSNELRQHQWKFVVTGLEDVVEFKGEGTDTIFSGESRYLFADEARLDDLINQNIRLERVHIQPSASQKQSKTPESISWLKSNIKNFSSFLDESIQLSDHSLVLNFSYYLERFYKILKSRPDLVEIMDKDLNEFQMEKLIKNLVDEPEEEFWINIVSIAGQEHVMQLDSDAISYVSTYYKDYETLDVAPPAFLHQVMMGQTYVFSNSYFRMNIVPQNGGFALLYNDEPERNVLKINEAKTQQALGQESAIKEHDTQIYSFTLQDVKTSPNEKFLLIRAHSRRTDEAYFLFINSNGLYFPFGTLNRYTDTILGLEKGNFSWIELLDLRISEKQDVYGTLDDVDQQLKAKVKPLISETNDTIRLYVNDPELAQRFGIYQNKEIKKNIQYDLLYPFRSNVFQNKSDNCILVLDTRYYLPSIKHERFYAYNPNQYEVYDAKIIDGVKYVFARDAREKQGNENRSTAKNEVIPTTQALAQAADRNSARSEGPSRDDLVSVLTPQPFLVGSVQFTNKEKLSAAAYFNSLEGNQADVWKDVSSSQIRNEKYHAINFETVLAVLHLAHITGNDDIRKKRIALAQAKQSLIELGFLKNDAFAIVAILAKAGILGTSSQIPDSVSRYESTSAESVAYGNEKFLDQLKFHVDDITDTLNNPFGFFRGLTKFYQDSDVKQFELEKLTRWIFNNYVFRIAWGKNQQNFDWGYSYLQMWHKSQYNVVPAPPEKQMVFLVDEKSRPFVLVRFNELSKKYLYDLHDLVEHLDEYITIESLKEGKPVEPGRYYYLTTNARPDSTEKTAWVKDEYEDLPFLAPLPRTIEVSDDAMIEKVDFHTHEPINDRIKNLGLKNSSVNEFMQKLIDAKVDFGVLTAQPVIPNGFYHSTRRIELGPNDEYYYKMVNRDETGFWTPEGDLVETAGEYKHTQLEYAVYLVDQKLSRHYTKSFLLEIDGKKVFFIKKEDQVLFNFTGTNGTHYRRINKEALDSLYRYNFIVTPQAPAPTLGNISKGAIKFDLPESVVLLDLLLGVDDRSLTKNVALLGNQVIDVRRNQLPLTIPQSDYRIAIYDGGYSFQFMTHHLIQSPATFTNWISRYYYDRYDRKQVDPRTEIKRILVENPDFSNRLAQWTPQQIQQDLHYLSKDHMNQLLSNRQTILDLALEAGVFAPGSASKN